MDQQSVLRLLRPVHHAMEAAIADQMSEKLESPIISSIQIVGGHRQVTKQKEEEKGRDLKILPCLLWLLLPAARSLARACVLLGCYEW